MSYSKHITEVNEISKMLGVVPSYSAGDLFSRVRLDQ